SSSKSFIEDPVTCHPRKLLHCHPQLDWGSSVFTFLYFLSFPTPFLSFCFFLSFPRKRESTVSVILSLTENPFFYFSVFFCHP
ncbi:hypothetical protein KBH77_00850, partial [Patescibacteria group bacterium]|nr:hypothetical protein [Patescibacteria group bacterium]